MTSKVMIMPIMHNMAIKTKLVSIIMLTCVAALLLAGGTFVFSEWASLRHSMVQNMTTHAAMTGDNCTAAIAFQDVNDAEGTLLAFREESSVVFACIYLKTGDVFASYFRDEPDPTLRPDGPKEPGHEFAGGLLTVFKPIVLDEETIGTICLRSDLQPMYSMLKAKSFTIIGVLLLASLAAYVFSSRLQRIISRPILKLADVAKIVSEAKDYSARAVKESNDEVGLLIDSFNEMLEQIHHRDVALVEANESLETRVKQRTAELTKTNRELHNSVERANLLAREAQEANEAKSQFLANMSHEIRTPMNGILGFADILADENLEEQHKKYVTTIRDCGRELLVLINDILDFSKIEANKMATEITACSLGEILNSIESLMRPKAIEKGLDFKVIESPGVPSEIHTDPVRLRQCLMNLVGNAVKFTEAGHVHVNISAQEQAGEMYVYFDVEDTGIGIPKNKLNTIFEVFTQADGSHTRKFGGSGLGLTITKRLAEILGGSLTVTSQENKGSNFSLGIPVGAKTAPQEAFLDRHNIADELQPKTKVNAEAKFTGQVLVAEDSLTNQSLIELLLKRMGLEVTIANDGKEAVSKAREAKFDLILMDMQMPNMNGYEATKLLRREGIKTPIVALTANAMKGDDKKCLAIGCDDYMSKPIDRKRLVEVLSDHLTTADITV
ncbi:MAG: response regulator [Sedimentisphaerales bacterium]|nr:response regulator [Sedimentisphaerales bacterium]